MNARTRRRFRSTTLVSFFALGAAACSLVTEFDESKIPSDGGVDAAQVDGAVDARADVARSDAGSDGAADATVSDAADGGPTSDGGSTDGGHGDTGAMDSGAMDSGAMDSGSGDAGPTDAATDARGDGITGFAYAPTASASPVMAQWAVHSDGGLTPLTPATVPLTGKNPVAIAATPDAKFLYVADGNAGTISQFAIAADGTVTPLSPPSVGGFPDGGRTDYPAGIAIHPSGRFAFVTKLLEDVVSTYSIGTSGTGGEGTLTFVRDTPVADGPKGVAVSPDGLTVFVVSTSATSVAPFAVADDGTLVAVPGASVTVAPLPFRITVSADGRYAYGTHTDLVPPLRNSQFAIVDKPGALYGADGGVTPSDGGSDAGLFVPPHGELVPLTPPTVPAEDMGSLIVTNRANTLAFGVNAVTSTVAQYSIGASTGALSPLTPATYPIRIDGGSSFLGDLALDPTDSFLYVANSGANVLHAFAVSPTGITPLTPDTIAAYPGTGRLLVVARP